MQQTEFQITVPARVLTRCLMVRETLLLRVRLSAAAVVELVAEVSAIVSVEVFLCLERGSAHVALERPLVLLALHVLLQPVGIREHQPAHCALVALVVDRAVDVGNQLLKALEVVAAVAASEGLFRRVNSQMRLEFGSAPKLLPAL